MADETELVHLERRDDGVAVLTLDNPKVNALSGAVVRQLRRAADELSARCRRGHWRRTDLRRRRRRQ
jgi:enoyl-CoA hydratase/carnithine racemase